MTPLVTTISKDMAKAIKKLQRRWTGPPIQLQIKSKSYLLGQGIPRTKVTIHKPSVLRRLPLAPSLTFGEAYMNGAIEVEGELLNLLRGFYTSQKLTPASLSRIGRLLSSLPISSGQAVKNAQHHYDIGNGFYKLWLDTSRTYSCAYFEQGNETLDEAQSKKRDLICRKLRLEKNQTFLDIGCGWGSLLFHAVEQYGVRATGITPAREQVEYIRQEAQRRGLSDQITVIEGEWRSLTGHFDRIASVGMFEHVGRHHYPAFLQHWIKLLKPDGISLLHTIGRRRPAAPDPWIRRYIFPGGYLPTLEEIAGPAQAAGLRIYRTENLRPHYAQTLTHWAANFTAHRDEIVQMFDERFARMWWLYLQGSEAGFRWGELELYQLELYGRAAVLPQSREIERPLNIDRRG